MKLYSMYRQTKTAGWGFVHFDVALKDLAMRKNSGNYIYCADCGATIHDNVTGESSQVRIIYEIYVSDGTKNLVNTYMRLAAESNPLLANLYHDCIKTIADMVLDSKGLR
jgi:hypothetical protein